MGLSAYQHMATAVAHLKQIQGDLSTSDQRDGVKAHLGELKELVNALSYEVSGWKDVKVIFTSSKCPFCAPTQECKSCYDGHGPNPPRQP